MRKSYKLPDARYTGHITGKKRCVARFCGDLIGVDYCDKTNAIIACREYAGLGPQGVDLPKIDLYVASLTGGWVYAFSTNAAKTCKGAAERAAQLNPGHTFKACFA